MEQERNPNKNAELSMEQNYNPVSYTHLFFDMAITKSAKIEAEIEKVKAKIAEQQARLKELEQKKLEAENSEIVEIVRGMSVSLTDLPTLLQTCLLYTSHRRNVVRAVRGNLNDLSAQPPHQRGIFAHRINHDDAVIGGEEHLSLIHI